MRVEIILEGGKLEVPYPFENVENLVSDYGFTDACRMVIFIVRAHYTDTLYKFNSKEKGRFINKAKWYE